MHFFQTIKDSIYNPKFYSSISKQSFWQAFRYFLLLTLLLSIIHTISFTASWLPTIRGNLEGFAIELINYYPQELVVNINNGQVTTNVSEPYILPIPKNIPQEASDSGVANLLVIDTKTPYSAAQFEDYKTTAWLSKDTLFVHDDNYEIKAIALSDVKSFKVDKVLIEGLYKNFAPLLNFVGPVLVLFSFLGIYSAYSARLIYLLIFALIIWLTSKLMKNQLNYSASYKTGMYAITLGAILDLLVSVTDMYTGFYGFPFMFTLINLAVVLVNLYKMKKS